MKAPVGPFFLLTLALLFFLPFIEFSCRDRLVLHMNGYEAAFGKKLEVKLPAGVWEKDSNDTSDASGMILTLKDERRTEGNGRVLAALIAAVLGGLMAFFWRPAGLLGGIVAVVLLWIVRADVIKEVGTNQFALLKVSFQSGYWASLICAGLGALACLWGGSKVSK